MVAEVNGANQKLPIVGADIEIDGNDESKVDPRCCGVGRQFANGNIGAIHAPITDAQDFPDIQS